MAPRKVKSAISEQAVCLSLRDVPLEVRRREAKKPLFLIRYE